MMVRILILVVFCLATQQPNVARAELLRIFEIEAGKLGDSTEKYDTGFTSLGLVFLQHDDPIDFTCLLKYQHLRSLGVGGIDEGDMLALIKFLKVMPCLSTLGIGGAQLRILPEALEELRYISFLSLSTPLLESVPPALLRMPSVRSIQFLGTAGPARFEPNPDSLYPYVYVDHTTNTVEEAKRLFDLFHLIVFADESYISMDDSVDSVADVQPIELVEVLSRSEHLRQILGTVVSCADTLTSYLGRVHTIPKYSLLAFEAGKYYRIRMFDDERIEVDGRILKPSILFRRFEAALELDKYRCRSLHSSAQD